MRVSAAFWPFSRSKALTLPRNPAPPFAVTPLQTNQRVIMATRKVRVKKLNTKQPLDVLLENEIDASEYQSLTQELSIATGVEQAEENVRTKSRALHVTRLPTLTLFRTPLLLTCCSLAAPSYRAAACLPEP